jgi:hypothetical protein
MPALRRYPATRGIMQPNDNQEVKVTAEMLGCCDF